MLKKFLAFSITAIMIFSLSACGNKEAEEKGDYLSGNKWESTAGMLLDLDKEGTFKFFKDKSDKEDNYYSGTFEVKSQRSAMVGFGVDENYYYALILTNKECIENGANTLSEENEVAYYGYYMPDYEYLNLYSLKTMTLYNSFYCFINNHTFRRCSYTCCADKKRMRRQ